MNDIKLFTKLLEASEISIKNNIEPTANYIHLQYSYIEKMAKEKNITVDEMVSILTSKLK